MGATSTGVGLGTAISAAIIGVPIVTVGAFVIPEALLVMLAAKKTKPQDQISISVALAYKLLERLDKEMHSREVVEQ